MANYFVSYDLNGPKPSHAEMDKHVAKSGWARGRILETVWYIGAPVSQKTVFDHFDAILSANDRLIVITASDAYIRNLLIKTESLQKAWLENA